jgi:hypothetical protein
LPDFLSPSLFLRVASLPEDVKEQLEDPDSRYLRRASYGY